MPNADKNSNEIDQIIKSFCNNKNNAKYFKSLGSLRYLSCMKIVDGIVGNSSSGLLEAPSFKIGTINIGNRQEGRLKSKSVIDHTDEKLIDIAFKKLFSSEFKINLESVVNPYGKGGACKKIFKIISKVDLESITKKSFMIYILKNFLIEIKMIIKNSNNLIFDVILISLHYSFFRDTNPFFNL